MDNVMNNKNADYLYNVLNIETTSRLWNICKRKPAIADICRTLNRTVAMRVSRKVRVQNVRLYVWTKLNIYLRFAPERVNCKKQLWTSLINEMGTE